MAGKTQIVGARGLEVLDSRGNPTVEAEVALAGGAVARAAVPSGASTGRREAAEKRDGGARFGGKGVLQAVAHVNGALAEATRGLDAANQAGVDAALLRADNSANKTRLGANAILAVSLASQKAAAKAAGLPLFAATGGEAATRLPAPLLNIINGGAHANNNLDIQEFMIAPAGFSAFADALRAGAEIFAALRRRLADAGLSTAVGDEGGFAPNINGTRAALDLLLQAVEDAGYRPGEQVGIALDCAAGEFFADGLYKLPADNFCGDAGEWTGHLAALAQDYPVVSIEDACDEGDESGWKLLSQQLGDKLQLVGDDLFVTNPKILQKGIDAKIANALLVKPNQVGTLTEAARATAMAKAANYAAIMSHRSGETEYADIADLAVGWGCSQIKAGAPCRGERTAKYNRLLRIEAALGGRAVFAGAARAASHASAQ